MAAFVRALIARNVGDTSTATATIDLGTPTSFLAWGTVTFIDSLDNFDQDNAVAIDIFAVDGVRTFTQFSGGDHLGPNNSPSNLLQGAIARVGQRVTFRLRAFHSLDLECVGYGIIITNP